MDHEQIPGRATISGLQQMLRQLAVLSCLTIFVAGCVFFPTPHTIFVPEAPLGKLEDSDVCGYMFNNKDLLVVSTTEYELQVQAKVNSSEDGQLTIFIQIVPIIDELKVDFEKFLVAVPGKPRLAPSTIARHEYGTTYENTQSVPRPETLEEATKKFFMVAFPVSPQGLTTFTLEFQDGALLSASRQLQLPPIRFRKVRKWDIYFGSINC